LLNLEPILPSLPLDDEGKEIIRQKLINEINQFLKKHNIEGHVEEVRITYILAN
jgi:flagellar basal body-associated protein FliL